MNRGRVLQLTVFAVSVFAVVAAGRASFAVEPAKPPAGVDAKLAYKKLKTLVGGWKASITHETASATDAKHSADHHPSQASVDFKLTGAGTALVETQFPGQGHEMVSVYHLDGDELRMTHYCAAGNQPRLKLDRAHSAPDHFVFVFDGGSNLDVKTDQHIHGVDITFYPDGRVVSGWEGFADGKKAETATFAMTRKP